ncbi:MAG: transposase [Acidobacteria bacterium]|nr:transposase [Acidobacteriota bacterium]
MLSRGWSGHGDVRFQQAAFPVRYSTTGQQMDHPLRVIRVLADEAVRSMLMQLERLYSTTGRLSIPPEQLQRALLFQVLCRIRSERLLMEELDYNPLFRWFVALNRTDRTTLARIGTGCRSARLWRPSSTQSVVRPVRRVCPPKSTSPSTGTPWEPVSVSAMTRTSRRTTEINAACDGLDALAAQRGRPYRRPLGTDRVSSDEELLR